MGKPFPNPSPQSIRLLLDGPADYVCVRIYTVNMLLVDKVEVFGSLSAGWVSVPLPAETRAKFAVGSQFFEAEAKRGSVKCVKPLVGTFVHLK
jgi:hypothetical protein